MSSYTKIYLLGWVMSDTSRYDPVARSLHWLVVVLVVAQFILGWNMPDVQADTKPINLIAAHLIVGVALVAAMICRLAWRFTHRPPDSELSPILNMMSSITHFALYGLLIAVPLLGWINASSNGWAVTLLWIIPLPALAPTGVSWGDAIGDLHGTLSWILFGVICLHVLAALVHRFVMRDSVIERMMPW